MSYFVPLDRRAFAGSPLATHDGMKAVRGTRTELPVALSLNLSTSTAKPVKAAYDPQDVIRSNHPLD